MSATTHLLLRQEAELLNRFADTYRGKFAAMIDQLNQTPDALPDRQCIRLCVETLSMLLATQTHLADALSRIGQNDSLSTAA